MTVRTVCNQTTRIVKRSVVVQASEISGLDGSVTASENNGNMVVYTTPGAWFYPGYEHIPCGIAQSGTAV